MAKPAPEYELVLMLDPEASDERRDQIAVEARRRIEDAGDLKQERSWGLRKMAYEINQRTEADYRFFRFQKGGSVLDDLNHSLKIADGVLRFRIFKVDPRSPVIDPPPPFSLAAEGRPGSRPRRDDDGGRGEGGYDERPPRAPQAGTAPTEEPPAAAEEPAAAAEEPAAPAEEPAAAAEEPAAEEPAAPAEEPATAAEEQRTAAEGVGEPAPDAEPAPAAVDGDAGPQAPAPVADAEPDAPAPDADADAQPA